MPERFTHALQRFQTSTNHYTFDSFTTTLHSSLAIAFTFSARVVRQTVLLTVNLGDLFLFRHISSSLVVFVIPWDSVTRHMCTLFEQSALNSARFRLWS